MHCRRSHNIDLNRNGPQVGLRRMYLLLLVFGAVLAVAGVLLTVTGVSLRDSSFDPAILTPGIVASVGGVLLIGLGAGLRTLQRIEQTLTVRPMPRPLTVPDNKPIELGDASREAAQLPFVLKSGRNSQAGGAVQQSAEESRNSASGEKTSLALPAIAPTRATVAEAETPPAGKGPNGAGAARAAQGNARPVAPAERRKAPAFDALWPKARQSLRAVEPPAPVQNAAVPAVEPHKTVEQLDPPAAHADAATDGLSVLKSGVVNGMPYTLFSDGSIEAQLPEGTLRFGSITELRNHIEQSA
jgi:hypothetical protein